MLNQLLQSLWNVKGSNNQYSNKRKDCNGQGIKLIIFTTEMKKETSHQIVKKKID